MKCLVITFCVTEQRTVNSSLPLTFIEFSYFCCASRLPLSLSHVFPFSYRLSQLVKTCALKRNE